MCLAAASDANAKPTHAQNTEHKITDEERTIPKRIPGTILIIVWKILFLSVGGEIEWSQSH